MSIKLKQSECAYFISRVFVVKAVRLKKMETIFQDGKEYMGLPGDYKLVVERNGKETIMYMQPHILPIFFSPYSVKAFDMLLEDEKKEKK